MVLAAGLAPALATFSTSCLCIGLREQRGWSLLPVLPRPFLFEGQVSSLLDEGSMWWSWRALPSPPPACKAGALTR